MSPPRHSFLTDSQHRRGRLNIPPQVDKETLIAEWNEPSSTLIVRGLFSKEADLVKTAVSRPKKREKLPLNGQQLKASQKKKEMKEKEEKKEKKEKKREKKKKQADGGRQIQSEDEEEDKRNKSKEEKEVDPEENEVDQEEQEVEKRVHNEKEEEKRPDAVLYLPPAHDPMDLVEGISSHGKDHTEFRYLVEGGALLSLFFNFFDHFPSPSSFG